MKQAVFGNGCFWCTEAVFGMLKGVISVAPGYCGGEPLPGGRAPTYDDLHTGAARGYAESLKIEYDPTVISYDDLLTVFFNTHDPTTLNRQGHDVGEEYRSIIFYGDDQEKDRAEAFIKELNDAKAYDKPVVTELQPASKYIFYPAENWHKDYYKNNPDQPYCQLVIAPKLEKVQKRFAELLK